MAEEKNFKRSQVEFILSQDLGELQTKINHCCKDKFVVGIQYPESLKTDKYLVAVISYKVQENSD